MSFNLFALFTHFVFDQPKFLKESMEKNNLKLRKSYPSSHHFLKAEKQLPFFEFSSRILEFSIGARGFLQRHRLRSTSECGPNGIFVGHIRNFPEELAVVFNSLQPHGL